MIITLNKSHYDNRYFFHFSGHGGRMKDYDGDEDDGYDETIYPVDHATYGQIVDDVSADSHWFPWQLIDCLIYLVIDDE